MADRKPQNNGFPGKTQTHIPTLDPPQKPKRNKIWGEIWKGKGKRKLKKFTGDDDV
ncbi:hypothetical protein CsSME_00015230 [Camellia sinensis var. sinensis]